MLARDFLQPNEPVILVEIAQTRGSTPRDDDAFMLVTQMDLFGTIGGGAAEYAALHHARVMLSNGVMADQRDITLGPETGQCCGGRLALKFTHLDDKARAGLILAEQTRRDIYPKLYILGAGHVGRALAHAAAPLPVQAILVDERAGEIALAPKDVTAILTAFPESVIDESPRRSAYVIVTHDHGLDFALAERALRRQDAAYVGMIGSASKRAQFHNYCTKEAPQTKVDRLHCPIGGALLANKDPAIIAAAAAVEIMAAFLSLAGD